MMNPNQKPYKCPICKEWFVKTGVSCCVLHPEGTCCHMGEPAAAPTPEYLEEQRIAEEVRHYKTTEADRLKVKLAEAEMTIDTLRMHLNKVMAVIKLPYRDDMSYWSVAESVERAIKAASER